MSGEVLATAMAWLLSAFFVFGACVNAIGPKAIREDYARWGYPKGFRFVTAVLELIAAVLVAIPDARPIGAVLAAAIMAAAVASTLTHGERSRAIAPMIVAAWACAVAALTWLQR